MSSGTVRRSSESFIGFSRLVALYNQEKLQSVFISIGAERFKKQTNIL
jgi:hypothetical protein